MISYIRISCGAANASGAAKELRLPWVLLTETYKHYNTKYPNELSRNDGEKHIEGLFADYID